MEGLPVGSGAEQLSPRPLDPPSSGFDVEQVPYLETSLVSETSFLRDGDTITGSWMSWAVLSSLPSSPSASEEELIVIDMQSFVVSVPSSLQDSAKYVRER